MDHSMITRAASRRGEVWRHAYALLWMITTDAVAGLGAAVVMLDHEVCRVAEVVAIAGAAAGGVIACVVRDVSQAGRTTGAVIAAGLAAGALILSGTGVCIFLGRSGIVLAMLLTLTSPPAVRCLGFALQPQPFTCVGATRPVAPTRDDEVLDSDSADPGGVPLLPVRTLTTSDLCLAWRLSFPALQRLQAGDDVSAQAKLVAERQGYLDELERRDPSGFHRWLDSGARPAGDPSKYVT